jgi:hypothetical protein
MVELDCSALIGAISEKNLDRSSLAYLIAEIRDLVSGNLLSYVIQNGKFLYSCPILEIAISGLKII